MKCLAASNCTITALDLSDNPLGLYLSAKDSLGSSGGGGGGDESGGTLELRGALSKCNTLTEFNLNRTQLPVEQILAAFGGLVYSRSLQQLSLQNAQVDEPCCFQLSHAITSCSTLTRLDLRHTVMGPRGGGIFLSRFHLASNYIRYLDLTGSLMGPVAAAPLAKCLQDTQCAIEVLQIANNALGDAGGQILAKALARNMSVTEMDLSGNALTSGMNFT
jgi:Ran GTPase-activating protein (RanGAP) involved in mRNA processing and transport